MKAKRIAGLTVLAAIIGAVPAWASATNSLNITVARHSQVGVRLRVTFAGRDSAPVNVVGTFAAAVLEPPLSRGGARCGHNLGATEQNHPASKELYFQKRLDPLHTGRYSVTRLMPAFTATGTWRVCAWQFNNDGRTSTIMPASFEQVVITVGRRGA